MQYLWMVGAALFFSLMAACVKFASEYFHPMELVGYRGTVACILLLIIMRLRSESVRTPVATMHAYRSVVGVLSLALWFYSITGLPLATATTLNFTSSIWLGVFLVASHLWLGQAKSDGRLVLTLVFGFIGVLLVLRPTFEQNQIGYGMVGLLSGVTAAMAYIKVSELGAVGEPETRTVFYFSLACAVFGFMGTVLLGFSSAPSIAWLWILPMGILALLGQWCMTRSYTRSGTLLSANLQYSGIIFSALLCLALGSLTIACRGYRGLALDSL